MKEFKVECRMKENHLDFGQLYAIVNDEGYVYVNGSVTVTDQEKVDFAYCTVNANICREDGAILQKLSCTEKFRLVPECYFSFSLSRYKRFENPEDVAYVEVYLRYFTEPF